MPTLSFNAGVDYLATDSNTGDFNQTVPRPRAPYRVVEQLQNALGDRFTIATSGELAPIGKHSIDHVGHTPDLVADRVAGIQVSAPFGKVDTALDVIEGWDA